MKMKYIVAGLMAVLLGACATPQEKTQEEASASAALDTNYGSAYEHDGVTDEFVSKQIRVRFPNAIKDWKRVGAPFRVNKNAVYQVSYKKPGGVLSFYVKDEKRPVVEGVQTTSVMLTVRKGPKNREVGVVEVKEAGGPGYFAIINPLDQSSRQEMVLTLPHSGRTIKIRLDLDNATRDAGLDELSSVVTQVLNISMRFKSAGTEVVQ